MQASTWLGRALAFVLLISLIPQLSAQISGRIVDETAAPVAAANVLLVSLPDSITQKGFISDAEGSFSFRAPKPGQYVVQVRTNYLEPFASSPIDITSSQDKVEMGEITLKTRVTELDAVTIVEEVLPMKQDIDRLTINVRAFANTAGITALELLERSPGLLLDRSNNSLSMAGKDGVIVMINGKRNYMPLSGVLQLLAGMSADEIEKIELITTPPANFDAEGNAGYINIILNDNSNYGFNGSVSLTGGYGRGERGNASVNFNYRRNRFNLYGNYSWLLNRQEQRFESYRRQMVEGGMDSVSTISDRLPQQLNHNVRLGMDYELKNNKTVIGLLFAGYDTKWTMDAQNTAEFAYAQRPDTLVELSLYELNQWRHYMGNANVQHQFNSRTSLTINADYLFYRDNNPTTYVNQYFDAERTLTREEQVRSGKITPIQIGVGSVDFRTGLGEKANLETGIKATLSRFTNDVEVANFQNSWIVDPSLTGVFFLREEIGAAYAAVDMPLGAKLTMKAGLRYEYTQSNLSSETEADIVDRQYHNLFPSIFFSRSIGENMGMNLSYSRRITRPTFNQMAPFVIFLDPTTFFSGNAALQPAISNSVKLDYRVKAFMFSLTYTHEDSSIARFQVRIDPETGRQIFNSENLRNTETLNLTATLPFRITKWWDMQYNLSGNLSRINAYVENTLVTLEQPFFTAFSAQKFKLPKGFTLEFSGFYRSKLLFGTAELKAAGILNAGIRKSFGPNGEGGTLSFNVNDMLNSMLIQSENDLPAFNLYTRGTFDFSQRTFLLSYNRNFGSTKVRASRQRNSASQEEQGRVE